MKKILFTLILFILSTQAAMAWDDCPFGLTDDQYPGECGRYIDTDGDGICDHSQLAPEERALITMVDSAPEIVTEDLITGTELKTKTLAEVAGIYEIDAKEYADALSEYYGVSIKPSDAFQFAHDNYGIEPSVAKDIASSIKLGDNIPTPAEKETKEEPPYHLVSITIVLLITYVVSHILSKKGIISIAKHRFFWNILLLISFLVLGILGILLVIKINFGIAILLPFNVLFWHVEAGIAMTVISIFHILWHLSYFKTLFKITK
ncbi:hypothetical protein KKD70_00470 [Patescibacteria group bacterium]|nr:hypothetical protein [Patescibacteria group bacterium]